MQIFILNVSAIFEKKCLFFLINKKQKNNNISINVSRGQNSDYLVLLTLTNRPNVVLVRKFIHLV